MKQPQPDTTLTPPPKVYIARLLQSGTNAPTALIFTNTLGNIIWTRVSQGYYIGTLTGAFKANKTWIANSDDDFNRVVMRPISYTGINKEAYQIYRESDNTIAVQVYDNTYSNTDLSTYTTFINLPEIRVYP